MPNDDQKEDLLPEGTVLKSKATNIVNESRRDESSPKNKIELKEVEQEKKSEDLMESHTSHTEDRQELEVDDIHKSRFVEKKHFSLRPTLSYIEFIMLKGMTELQIAKKEKKSTSWQKSTADGRVTYCQGRARATRVSISRDLPQKKFGKTFFRRAFRPTFGDLRLHVI
ncbi:hypothetical protein M9H77_29444 [Catharanthus roseus]|uniref:Uncharacterized protein n=1 Tax=Catharanthus roseus TaxID=4058 RepID=A0ACB9ZUF7_CATRO|nr:hypothetical protein M9H77_29444 [Catharanthus roseus]